MEVRAADGVWLVRRRWAPRRLGAETIWARFKSRSQKARRRTADAADLPDPGCVPDLAEGVAVFLVVLVIVLFMVFIGIPFLIALGELLFVVLFAVLGLIGRVLFRRPWTIDAVAPEETRSEWLVVGWRRSGAARQFVADRVAATGTVPTADEVAAQVLGV